MIIDEILEAIPQWFEMHSNIMVSVSGGSDSDVMLLCKTYLMSTSCFSILASSIVLL